MDGPPLNSEALVQEASHSDDMGEVPDDVDLEQALVEQLRRSTTTKRGSCGRRYGASFLSSVCASGASWAILRTSRTRGGIRDGEVDALV